MFNARIKNILGCRKKSRRAGFTLIEMFIVIAVIGILAGVVFRGTAAIQASARDTRRINDMRSVQNYLERYFFMCGHYPGGGNCEAQITNTWSGLRDVLVAARVITEARQFPEPPTRNPDDTYSYAVDSVGNLSYVIKARLENRNQVLDNDIDGTVLGLFCDDVDGTRWAYCLRP